MLGTGIGGGLVVDGRLRFGPHGRAGELGHQIVVPNGPLCGCGNRGCLEAVATGRRSRHGRPGITRRRGRCRRNGDERALRAIEVVADYLGLGIANVITMIVPSGW